MTKIELLTETQAYETYDESLDCEGTVTVAGLEMYPSNILEKCDPIAYNCGFSDHLDYLVSDNDYLYEGDAEKGVDYWECPECGDLYDDEEEAKECCDCGEVE